MIFQPHELPLVSFDVSDQETMKDVVHSLDSLALIMDSLFNRLESKVASERKRLSNINHRIANCQTKVQALKGSDKPTTVLSTSKFPGTKTCTLYEALQIERDIGVVCSYYYPSSLQLFAK